MHHAPMTINQDIGTANVQRQQRLMAAGGLVGALAAARTLSALLHRGDLGCLGYGYWLVYRSTKLDCGDGEACARPLSKWLVQLGLIAATVLVVAAIGFNFLAPLLLNS